MWGVALGACFSLGFAPRGESEPQQRPYAPPALRAVSVDSRAATPEAQAVRDFLARYGGTWWFDADARTGLVVMARGSGIPWIPGRGNALGADALAGLPLPDGEVTLETLEPLARAFIAANAPLLAPRDGVLVLDRVASGSRDGGRLWSLEFRWLVGDVAVDQARVFLRLNNGNLTQFGAPYIGRAGIDPRPTLGADEARAALLAWSGHGELARFVEEPELRIQPEEAGDRLAYRLVWVMRYRVRSGVETWEGRVDAHTGEVVAFEDVNRYGRVRGGVYPRTVVDTEISAPLPLVRVEGEVPRVSDRGGFFDYTGGTIQSGLDGEFFRTSCQDGCSNPPQASASAKLGIGWLDFGLGGQDEIGNGSSTRAERTAFYHANQVRRVAKKWLSISWLDQNIGVNVNIADTCNAFWDGSANFFRSGGGCNNTGEIADVVYHEWGHGIDGNTRAGDGATGEGTGDVVSTHMTHDARIGPYFQTDGDAVRDLDKNRTSKGLLTRSNVTSKCPPGSGPLGREVHCEGEIYGQTSWDLSMALVAKHGHHTGWRTSERIFFVSLPDAGSYLPDRPFPIYDAYLQADDDNGNLADGTPNGAEIFQAFDTHEIAGRRVGSSPACARPAQPVPTATPGCGQVTVSWNEVAQADHYVVMRAEILADGPFFPLAQLPAGTTSFVDREVGSGVDYHYVVMAVAADGCESTIESPVRVRLDPAPLLSVTSVTPTDEPRGNRSGFPDPGEEVDLQVRVGNLGDLDASAISGVLASATPGVTLLDDTDSWPDLAPGTQALQAGTLRFSTDGAQVACGDVVRFRLDLSEASGCSGEASYFDVVMGDRQSLFHDDFETDQGWALDTVNSTATAGNWTRGDPDGTSFQPEDDVSEPGALCWFTAPNAGGVGTDDVDGGVTILVSPVLDLSGFSQAIVSYSRWFANRDLGEDAGDFFAADVSADGGATWVNLETLGTNETAPSWVRREFHLEQFIPLTDQVRLRFQASDGPATGNLIEAAVDEVRIEEPVCDDTPACFTEPTFAGLESAQPGSSCGEIELAWQAASSNCQNATITYRVYRSTDPAFVPGPANLVAQGLTGTSFTDTLLQPGVTYFYIVRAFDSRSGEDTNLERRSATSPSEPDLRPPVFAGLAAADAGANCGEVVLGWSEAQETCSAPVAYQVYRSTDPAFVPGPANLVGSTLSVGFVDAALVPGQAYTYVVRALDEAGNEDANDVRLTVVAKALDRSLASVDFEQDNGGWSPVAPNDATTGRWEWGDPEGTGVQPEDDHTPAPGTRAWITGLAAAGGDGGNDVDGGTTTLLSTAYDLSSAVDPVVRYARWFTNDRGGSPGEDPLDVEVSADNGATWTSLERVSAGTPLAWVEVEHTLADKVGLTSQMRFRFTARDLGAGSLVEAGVDDFELLDRGQGCGGCPTPVEVVGTIFVARAGDDVVLDWSADPVNAVRYVVYKLAGADFSEAVRIGTAETKSFVHEGAALSGESFFYRVSAVDACGNESALE